MINVIFDHQAPAAEHIYSFYFRAESPLRHIAGQFIELYIPHRDPDERGIKHWFTLSSSPTEGLLAITTRLDPDRSSSFKTALKNLQRGTELKMAAPMGDFVLPKDPSIPLLFVAGGIGTTPFRSIIKHLQDSGEIRDITFLYTAHSDSELAFTDIFSKLGNKFIPLSGKRLSSAKILNQASPKHYVYLSGPEPMVESLDKELKAAGVNPQHLRTDFFLNYSTI